MYVQPQDFGFIAVMGIWWDSLCDWSVDMKGYMLFWRDRAVVRQHLKCVELCLGEEDEKSFWAGTKGRTSNG